jgi:hypothetical protein
MPIPWIDSVKSSGRLTVQSSLTGTWRTVFRDTIRNFNTLSRGNRLGVTLTEVSDGNANVEVRTGNGTVSCSYGGSTETRVLAGERLHGATLLFSVNQKLEKAFVFVPEGPLVNTPRGRRPVGTNVMKVILAHEFVHACGLTNGEHSNDDLFQANPQVDPGTHASSDKVRIEVDGRMRWMPPLALAATTAGNITRLWR